MCAQTPYRLILDLLEAAAIISGIFDRPDACLRVFILWGLHVNLIFASQNDVYQIDFKGGQI